MLSTSTVRRHFAAERFEGKGRALTSRSRSSTSARWRAKLGRSRPRWRLRAPRGQSRAGAKRQGDRRPAYEAERRDRERRAPSARPPARGAGHESPLSRPLVAPHQHDPPAYIGPGPGSCSVLAPRLRRNRANARPPGLTLSCSVQPHSAHVTARSKNTYLRAQYEQVKRRRGHK